MRPQIWVNIPTSIKSVDSDQSALISQDQNVFLLVNCLHIKGPRYPTVRLAVKTERIISKEKASHDDIRVKSIHVTRYSPSERIRVVMQGVYGCSRNGNSGLCRFLIQICSKFSLNTLN